METAPACGVARCPGPLRKSRERWSETPPGVAVAEACSEPGDVGMGGWGLAAMLTRVRLPVADTVGLDATGGGESSAAEFIISGRQQRRALMDEASAPVPRQKGTWGVGGGGWGPIVCGHVPS
ncbi:hypothetical protein NHX12_021323 [Muraenolepis orangiensis]|uniref:Uncharacterized protein n=1 Tax=Muraenolepis orangiensis TaxID=630683 RepID=A0A9Q0IS79_9TELE|nr:hypothetical protein NHX12_021323 [Muraenolepis orangiensis]